MRSKDVRSNCLNYIRYKKILEECILIPFKFIAKPETSILPSFIRVNIPNENFCIPYFTAHFKYGKTEWKVSKSNISLLNYCMQLEKQGICIENYRTLRNIFNITKETVVNILYDILQAKNFYKVPGGLLFFRISEFSFNGQKMYEDTFHVTITEMTNSKICCDIFICGRSNIKTYYVVCKNTHIILYDYKINKKVDKIIMYSRDMIFRLIKHSLYTQLLIIDNKTKYQFASLSVHRIMALYNILQESMNNYKKTIVSHVPPKNNNICNFLIDGKEYYEDLYHTINCAKSEIYIAGWWIYPKLFLKRGRTKKMSSRLDRLLKKKAKMGVKIYILIYKEIEFTISINSDFTAKIFQNLHPNIFVLRHPNNTPNNVTFWSHHEKIVCVDQNIVYIGGIDLCLGRYDTKDHLLFEKQNRNLSNTNGLYSTNANMSKYSIRQDVFMWPGIDFSNPLKKDFSEIENSDTTLIDRTDSPRMPWHDVQMKIIGSTAFDIVLHFIQRWNFLADNLLVPNEKYYTNIEPDSYPYIKCMLLRSVGQWSLNKQMECSIYESYKDIIRNSEKFLYIENQFLVTKCHTNDTENPVNTIGLEIVNKIKHMKERGLSYKVYIILPLLPAFELDLSLETKSAISHIIKIQTSCINSLIDNLKQADINYEDYILFLSLQKFQKKTKAGEVYEHEQIYVHSKLIISDGTKMIIGSANINDRSMLGDRDSELCTYIEDHKYGQIKTLLKRLLHEHTGYSRIKKHIGVYAKLYECLKSENLDLSSNAFFTEIKRLAQNNTKIYNQNFSTTIDNSMTNLTQYFESMGRRKRADKNDLRNIFGNLVIYAHKFLVDEQFRTRYLSLDCVIPEVIYF